MDTGGGFLFDAGQGAQAGPSSSAGASFRDRDQFSSHEDEITVRKLSSKQEIRLINYLDDAFLELNRGFNKR
jgi:hypothetical protein